MMNGNKKSATRFYTSNVMLHMKKMQTELNEHRYHLERKVEQRTEHLVKRIAVLESCNATLCDKLALAQKEIFALKKQTAHLLPKQTLPKKEPEQKSRAVQLYVMNDQAQKLIGLSAQDRRDAHAAA